jgi:hypothetical protein
MASSSPHQQRSAAELKSTATSQPFSIDQVSFANIFSQLSNVSQGTFMPEEIIYRSIPSIPIEEEKVYRSYSEDTNIKSAYASFSSMDSYSGKDFYPSISTSAAAYIDDTTVDVNILPPEVPSGGYLEPGSTVACRDKVKPAEVLRSVKESLAANNVDFRNDPFPDCGPADNQSYSDLSSFSDCSVISSTDALDISLFPSEASSPYILHCLCYPNGSPVPFMVSIFRKDDVGQQLVVEFQKRMGCSVQFAQVYLRLRKELFDKGVIDEQDSGNESSFSSMAPPPLPELMDDNQVQQNASASIKALMQMVDADYSDVKIQGLESLSHLSCERSAQEALAASEDSLSKLVETAKEKPEPIHRPAIATLANIVANKRTAVAKYICGKGICDAALLLLNSSVPQVVRDSARLIAGLSTSLGSDLPTNVVKAAVTALSSKNNDLEVRKQANVLLQAAYERGDKLDFALQALSSGVAYSKTISHSHSF